MVSSSIRFGLNMSTEGVKKAPLQKASIHLWGMVTAISVAVAAAPISMVSFLHLLQAYTGKRLTKASMLLLRARASESLGLVTTLCLQTESITRAKHKVVAGFFLDGDSCLDFQEELPHVEETSAISTEGEVDCAIPVPENLNSSPIERRVPQQTRELIEEAIISGTTAVEVELCGRYEFIGSKTEVALLDFAKDKLSLHNLNERRANLDIIDVFISTHASWGRCHASVVRHGTSCHRLYVYGDAERLLKQCSMVDPRTDSSQRREDECMMLRNSVVEQMTQRERSYTSRSLETIAIVYKDLDCGVYKSDPQSINQLVADMKLLTLLGISLPVRVGVTASIEECRAAAVRPVFVSKQNATCAMTIASNHGLFTAGGIVLEGPDFRKLSAQDLSLVIPRLQVLASSSPADRTILVRQLRTLGEIVAITGSYNDEPALLKGAQVGISLASGGDALSKASDFVLEGDDFRVVVLGMDCREHCIMV